MNENDLYLLLDNIRSGGLSHDDATEAQIQWCISEGLVEHSLPPEITITQAYEVSNHQSVDFDNISKLYPVDLTPKGKKRLEELRNPVRGRHP